jgi:two-component system, chemotaxis family, CheB/CheR fusion protein
LVVELERKNRTLAPNGPSNDALTIVGIGASAGGLAALQIVLSTLPANQDVAYVIAQHLAPKYISSLPKLLARHTAIPVETIIDGMPVRPNRIYVTPPGKEVGLSENRLRLRAATSVGPKPSIDAFFESLAVEKGCRAVGIILSGTGSDGAHGIRAIKAHEGITMAQTSASAKFYGMPQAAVDTGFVDLVLPPEKIGQALASALTYPSRIADPSTPDPSMDATGTILQMLREQLGVDFTAYRPAMIERRIRRRMAILSRSSIPDYVDHLLDDPGELAVLGRDMLILATRFFRNPQAFEALAVHLRDLLAGKLPGDSIRIWIPGCSSGEEAYSIAILVADILGKSLNKYKIQLFATDIDEVSIELARKATYPLTAVMDGDLQRFESYLVRGENTITVKKRIRDMVILARQDLMKDAPFLHLDLISCRNLMTDVNPDMQAKILSLFHYLLNPKGLLFIGRSESIDAKKDLFDPVDDQWKIFRRGEVAMRGFPQLIQSRHHAQLVRDKGQYSIRNIDRAWKERGFIDALVEVLDCCGVLIDEQANILYVRGDLSAYFKFPEGSMRDRFSAIDMARPHIRPMLQSMLRKAAKEAHTITSNAISLGDNGNHRGVRIRIGSVPTQEAGRCRLIVFTPVERLPAASDVSTDSADPQRVAELERILADTREQLQDTIEQLETSNEELQSLNEEMQTSNEELQATNEELETSNEELQATNEELSTVNDELRANSEEAERLISDLQRSEKRNQLLVAELETLVKERTSALDSTQEALHEASQEQQLAEGKLRRLSKVFMDSADPIIIEDLDTTIVDANRAAEEVYGFVRAESLQYSDLWHRPGSGCHHAGP